MCNLISGSNIDMYSQSEERIPKNNPEIVAFLFKFIHLTLKYMIESMGNV